MYRRLWEHACEKLSENNWNTCNESLYAWEFVYSVNNKNVCVDEVSNSFGVMHKWIFYEDSNIVRVFKSNKWDDEKTYRPERFICEFEI